MTAAGAASGAGLGEAIEQALALIEARDPAGAREPQTGRPVQSLPSLLEQCEALCRQAERRETPLRMLHQMACTGGTLVAKCVAALPNCQLLNEIDPFSTLHLRRPNPPFLPTDLIANLHHSLRPVPQALRGEIFLEGLKVLQRWCRLQGRHLVLRDHAHSQFCTAADPGSRPTMRTFLSGIAPVLSVLTVRHPLESFLGLEAGGWTHFAPFTLEEYCRRYLQFLEAHHDVPRLSYEEFVADPETQLARVCDWLELRFDPAALEAISLVRLSGDSGRSGSRIAPRPRRPLNPALEAERESAPAYRDLCAELGYAP